MADPETTTGGLGNLFSFFSNAPSGSAMSYPAMEMRRRIALQLVANAGKKGYPKTLGEGLTAIGDALGERATMNQLAQQEAEYQKTAAAAAEEAVPAEARTGAPPAMKASSYAPTTDDTTDTDTVPAVRAINRSIVPPDTPPAPPDQPPAPPVPPINAPIETLPNGRIRGNLTNPNAGGPLPSLPVGPQSALPQQQGVASITGVNPRAATRDAIAQLLSGQTAPGVPQPNPTPAAALPPTSLPATPAGLGGRSPDQRLALAPLPPATSGTMTDIQPASPLPSQLIRPAPPAAPAPVQVAQAATPSPPAIPQRVQPQPRIPLPTDVPMTEDEKRGYQLKARALALGDPNMQQQAETLISYGAAQRKQQYDAILQDYRDQMLERRQRETAEEAFARTQSTPEHALQVKTAAEELAKAQNENRLRAQFGNLPPDEVFKQVNASRVLAKGAQQALVASQSARDALDKGAITGAGANQRLDLAKLLTGLGLADKGNVAANTEVFKAAMQPIVASILHQTSGTSQLSEGELAFAKSAAAGNISMEPQAIRELIRIIDKRSNEVLKDHQTLTDALFGRDNPQAKAMFGVEAPKTQDDQAREWLQNNPNDPRAPAVRQKLGIR